jgi:ribosomal RNA-processing protein 8
MALFQVPGWSMPAAPVSALSQSTSKKRKRPATQEVDKVQSVEVNLDKLMQKLGRDHEDEQGPKKKKSKHGKTPQGMDTRDESATSSKGKKKNPSSLGVVALSVAESSKPPTKVKQKKKKKPVAEKASSSEQQPRNTSPAADGVSGLTSLQKGMKESLDGARFRYVF